MIKKIEVPDNFSCVIDRGDFQTNRSIENYIFMAKVNMNNKKYFTSELNSKLRDRVFQAIYEQKMLNYGTTIHLLTEQGIKETPISTAFEHNNTIITCDFKNIIYEKELDEDYVSQKEIIENAKEVDRASFKLFCELYFDEPNIINSYAYQYLKSQANTSASHLIKEQEETAQKYIPQKYQKLENYWYIDYIDNKFRIYNLEK